MGLPNVPYEYVPPMLVADVGANPWRYGNQGILLNSDGLKQFLFGPIDGPPRNTAQIGTARMMRRHGTLIKFVIFGIVMSFLTAFLFFIFGQYRTGADQHVLGRVRRRVAAQDRGHRPRRRYPGRHRQRPSNCGPTSRFW